mmetsp:Transcript_31097/g.82763  ORF Transcript_31097/g.82763 Transcript_31097/m.82763 type:complete len:154 (-) Transcript_31097:85-546(-)
MYCCVYSDSCCGDGALGEQDRLSLNLAPVDAFAARSDEVHLLNTPTSDPFLPGHYVNDVPLEHTVATGEVYTIALQRVKGDKLNITLRLKLNRLWVTEIRPGVVDLWNAEHPDLCVCVGDFLIAVNGLRDCKPKALLRALVAKNLVLDFQRPS